MPADLPTLFPINFVRTVLLRDCAAQACGERPARGSDMSFFFLAKIDVSEAGPADFQGMRLVLNIFPVSIPMCVAAVWFRMGPQRLFATLVYVSADLSFTHKWFCKNQGSERGCAVFGVSFLLFLARILTLR